MFLYCIILYEQKLNHICFFLYIEVMRTPDICPCLRELSSLMLHFIKWFCRWKDKNGNSRVYICRALAAVIEASLTFKVVKSAKCSDLKVLLADNLHYITIIRWIEIERTRIKKQKLKKNREFICRALAVVIEANLFFMTFEVWQMQWLESLTYWLLALYHNN